MTIPETYDDYLTHYGIKGMKWGRRRDGGSDGLVSTTGDNKKTSSSEPSGEKTPNKVFNKKNAAIAAGVVAGAAAVGVTAMGARHIQKGRRAAAVAQIQNVASKSLLDMYLDSAPKPAPKPTYKSRSKQMDTKLYGEKGAKRIEKKLNKGVPLRQARQKEAARAGAKYATKVAANLALARIQA